MDADVNAFLRQSLEAGRRFDAIVLDPPKFAPTAAHAERAARAYKDINRLALMLLAPGGLLFTFSCSGGIGAELFHKIVAGAGHRRRRGRRHRAAPGGGLRPPDDAGLPRRRIPQGPGDPEGGLSAARSSRGSNLARLTLK